MTKRTFLLPLVLLGCGGGGPAPHAGHHGTGATCRIDPQPLRANSTIHGRDRIAEIADFPARGAEPARHTEAIEEREETATLLEVDGATVRRVLVDVTRQRLRAPDGKMLSGPMDGLHVEIAFDEGAVTVHPIGAPLDDASKKVLVDRFRHLGVPNPFLTIGTTFPVIGGRSAAYETAIAKWMHRDRPDASGHAPEVHAVLARCDPDSATFQVQMRLVGRELGWDLDGKVEGRVVIARRDGRPTQVLLRTVMTGTAPDAAGPATIKAEQSVDDTYE